MYFLFSAIIQCIPTISPLNPVTAIVPLVCVLCVSIIRELIKDIQRYNYDKLNNEEKVIVLREGKFVESVAGSLRVGEIVLVKEDCVIPSDMAMIDSFLSDGQCYVETSSLDGEKSLKEKIAPKAINGVFSDTINNATNVDFTTVDIDISGFCQCNYPNPDLNRLDGKIDLHYSTSLGTYIDKTFPIEVSQLLLKGAFLRNTPWVAGIVLYTGMSNKIMLNSKKPRMKISIIEKRMNKYLIGIFVIQVVLCIVCAITNNIQSKTFHIFAKNTIKNPKHKHSSAMDSFLAFFTYFLLLNTLIPISLIITMEIVKMCQGYFIICDVELYSKIRKKFCKVKSVSLNEELGNVNYIFSDKTGTLTSNKMQFKYCIIGGKCYEYCNPAERTEPELNETIQNRTNTINSYIDEDQIIKSGNNHFEEFRITKETEIISKEMEIIDEFWKALSTAHECICTEKHNKFEYSGISPDEIELVKAASLQGFSYLPSQRGIRRLKICNKEKQYQILNILGFTSERKRMSIILKDRDNMITMYTQGADCEIKKRLNESCLNDPSFLSSCKYIDTLSSQGYRTLLIAFKKIKYSDYIEWNKKLKECEMNINKKHSLIDKCYDFIEKDFEFLGATVVEDKLQMKVPETIKQLRQAGIKIWVLTGDKIDTSENIALSCNLISKKHKIFKLAPFTKKDIKLKQKDKSIPELEHFLIEFNEFQSSNGDKVMSFIESTIHQSESLRRNLVQSLINGNKSFGSSVNRGLNSDTYNYLSGKHNSIAPFSILIESSLLSRIFSNENNVRTFLTIALSANTVICCRVSPLQKSQVVKKVKLFDKNAITLAIDGENDVSMIMEAHIGIGLYGEEGMRAVQASDFAIGEFRYLERLLFFHGRTNSNRIGRMILYFFYKNVVFTMLHFYYAFYCLSSGQTIIDDWFITFYNLLFTAVPLCVVACTDFDIRTEDGDVIPQMMPFLYRETRDSQQPVCLKAFFCHLLKGILVGFVNYVILIFSNKENMLNEEGDSSSLWYLSFQLYTNIIISMSCTLTVTVRYMTLLYVLSVIITTFGFYFSFVFYANSVPTFASFGSILVSFKSIHFYLGLLCVCVLSFVVDYTIYCYQFLFSSAFSYQLMVKNHNKELSKNKRTFCSKNNLAKSKSFHNKNRSIIEDQTKNEMFYDSKVFLKINVIPQNDMTKKLSKKSKSNSFYKNTTEIPQPFEEAKSQHLARYSKTLTLNMV